MFGQHDHHDQDNNDAGHAIHTSDDAQTNDNASGGDNWQHPGVPIRDDNDDASSSAPAGHDEDTSGLSGETAQSEHTEQPQETAPDATAGSSEAQHNQGSPAAPDANHDLTGLKQEALTKLSPLVDHLDQSPEEKFRTLMMMIQASDDQALIKQAYESALKIEDEKERAQALLDIVNEINYFTQNSSTNE